eukprot:NODE_240_length_3167_cov_16.451051_g209_i0.p1 GENE.NODE_240_length_3167_cov_16.451051_g209_i0~~NODE_240_length_3167_cov_16.451051_g209_i0.p1  ORF type:complete len:665 (-),score=56.52 NODE_240_length_3167_cov_16.451051_g209_i0:1061-3055(-)
MCSRLSNNCDVNCKIIRLPCDNLCNDIVDFCPMDQIRSLVKTMLVNLDLLAESLMNSFANPAVAQHTTNHKDFILWIFRNVHTKNDCSNTTLYQPCLINDLFRPCDGKWSDIYMSKPIRQQETIYWRRYWILVGLLLHLFLIIIPLLWCVHSRYIKINILNNPPSSTPFRMHYWKFCCFITLTATTLIIVILLIRSGYLSKYGYILYLVTLCCYIIHLTLYSPSFWQEKQINTNKVYEILQFGRKYYILRKFLQTSFEVIIQLINFFDKIHDTDNFKMLFPAIIISLDLIARFPLLMILGPYGPHRVWISLVLDILIDLAYIIINSNYQSEMSIWGVISLGIPGIWCALSIRTLCNLLIQSSYDRYQLVNKVNLNGATQYVQYGFSIISFFIGFTFLSMFLSKSIQQHYQCISQLGILWTRTYPKVYFNNGFFGDTSCGFKLIQSLDLTKASLSNISSNIIHYYNLQELDLSNNQFYNLDSLLIIPSLRKLIINNNPLITLPRWILTSSDDIKLELSSTKIQFELDLSYPICEINNVVKNSFMDLLSLTIKNCSLDDIPIEVSVFNKTLERLDLSFNKITVINETIGEVLPKLIFLNVSNNPVSSQGLLSPYIIKDDDNTNPRLVNQAKVGNILKPFGEIDISHGNLTKFPSLLTLANPTRHNS